MARAENRFQRDKFRKRNQRNYPTWPSAWMFGETRVRCSKWCCGNARKVYGRDLQELRELQSDLGKEAGLADWDGVYWQD